MMTSALVTLLADIAALNTVAMDQLVELRAGALIGYELLLFFYIFYLFILFFVLFFVFCIFIFVVIFVFIFLGMSYLFLFLHIIF